MKRSEMIQNIASELIHPNTNFMSYDKALELAEIVLNRIEREGMLPPNRPELVNNNKIKTSKDMEKMPTLVIINVNTWGPENEA